MIGSPFRRGEVVSQRRVHRRQPRCSTNRSIHFSPTPRHAHDGVEASYGIPMYMKNWRTETRPSPRLLTPRFRDLLREPPFGPDPVNRWVVLPETLRIRISNSRGAIATLWFAFGLPYPVPHSGRPHSRSGVVVTGRRLWCRGRTACVCLVQSGDLRACVKLSQRMPPLTFRLSAIGSSGPP